jgi:hypothetical protein
LRQYSSGIGKWILMYRTTAGIKRTETIGDATVLTIKFAEEIAVDILRQRAAGKDPAGERKKEREREKRTVGAVCREYFEDEGDDGGQRLAPRTATSPRTTSASCGTWKISSYAATRMHW